MVCYRFALNLLPRLIVSIPYISGLDEEPKCTLKIKKSKLVRVSFKFLLVKLP